MHYNKASGAKIQKGMSIKNQLKRVAGHLPAHFQNELKRIQFASEIAGESSLLMKWSFRGYTSGSRREVGSSILGPISVITP